MTELGKFLPEYWDNHHQQDICRVHKFSLNLDSNPDILLELGRKQLELAKRLAKQLERFSLISMSNAVVTPLAEFGNGSTFRPNAYLHGTLIRSASERLNLTNVFGKIPPERYNTAIEFGFIVDANGIFPNEENVILYVSKIGVYGGNPDDIRVGSVEHIRCVDRGKLIYESLTRVNKVEIVSVGGGIRRPKNAIQRALSFLSPVRSQAT